MLIGLDRYQRVLSEASDCYTAYNCRMSKLDKYVRLTALCKPPSYAIETFNI